jgi:oxidase EvaA
MIFKNLQQLIGVRDQYANALSVKPVNFRDCDNWQYEAGKLIHVPPAYFEVVAVETYEGKRLILHQPESAIVMLLTTPYRGENYFLISVRAEPGLQQKAVITSTIQSTPSNLKQIHGGLPTPFTEYLQEQENIVFTTVEYDYGSIYLNKVKTFSVIEIIELIDPPDGFAWVSESLMIEALFIDDLLGTDLRALLAQYLLTRGVRSFGNEISLSSPQAQIIPLEELDNHVMDEKGIVEKTHQQGASLIFVETTTPVREVQKWTQPLIQFENAGIAGILKTRKEGEILYSVTRRTEIGIAPRNLWYPAIFSPPGQAENAIIPQSAKCVRANLEGGRFHRSNYLLFIADADEYSPSDISDIHWLTLEQIRQELMNPCSVSVELRMVLSLLLK